MRVTFEKIDGEHYCVYGVKLSRENRFEKTRTVLWGRCHDVWHLFDKMMCLDLLFYHFLGCLYIFVATISRNYTKELYFSVSP